MIHGVYIKQVIQHPAPDGFFVELVKEGEQSFHEIKQTSYSQTLPGTIKAFHLHKGYWEIWCVLKGRAKIVMYDGRPDSPTQGETQVLFSDEKDMKVVAIPPGVAHGYQVLGSEPVGMLYHAGKAYDPKNPGIEEIPFDDPKINFNWHEN